MLVALPFAEVGTGLLVGLILTVDLEVEWSVDQSVELVW